MKKLDSKENSVGGSPSITRLKENSQSFFQEKAEKTRKELRNLNRLRKIDMCLMMRILPSELSSLSEEDYEEYQWYYDQVTRPDSEILGVHPSMTGLIHVPTISPHHLRALMANSSEKKS